MELRKVERRLPDGGFAEIKFAELKKGDAFKLYDCEKKYADGTPCRCVSEPLCPMEVQSGSCFSHHEQGTVVYIAQNDAEPCEPEGNFGVRVTYIY
jgi:hypothetical protein